jgi:CRP-like cAMP-binding protein
MALELVGRPADKKPAPDQYPSDMAMKPTLPSDVYNVLVGRGTNERFSRLQRLKSSQHQSPCAFLLTEGWAASATLKNNGQLCMISMHFAGDIIGLSQAFNPACRELSFALSPVSALPLSTAVLNAILANPDYSQVIHDLILNERAMLIDRLLASSQGDTATKLAQFIFDLAAKAERRVLNNRMTLQTPLRQSDIADFINTTSVHVNRTLRDSPLINLVDIRYGIIKIHDFAALSLLAGRRRPHLCPSV